jgi:hypothetical protein
LPGFGGGADKLVEQGAAQVLIKVSRGEFGFGWAVGPVGANEMIFGGELGQVARQQGFDWKCDGAATSTSAQRAASVWDDHISSTSCRLRRGECTRASPSVPSTA